VATLQNRVVNILKTPATEWPVVAAESTDVSRLYTEYIIPLSAIPVVARFLGLSFIGSVFPAGGLIHIGIMSAAAWTVVSYLLGLLNVYICAVVIEWLAPQFKSSGSRIAALKLVAYASTPIWIAGIFSLFPLLGVLALLGVLYAIYLFYLGLPPLMKTPADQVVIYMIVIAVVIIIVGLVLGSIATALTIGSAYSMMR
jgi:hypothetical protein